MKLSELDKIIDRGTGARKWIAMRIGETTSVLNARSELMGALGDYEVEEVGADTVKDAIDGTEKTCLTLVLSAPAEPETEPEASDDGDV